MSTPAVNIVTGFLGSGKTTLLKHVLLNGLGKRRVALIINEMADLGIDGRLIECANVEKMVELNNGCICCTINREFASALQSIIETANPHLIIIEATGAADVIPLIDEIYACGLKVDSCITVIDACNFFSACQISDVVIEQAAAADFLVLNKVDLATVSELNKVSRFLRRINSRALIVETRNCGIESDLFFATCAASFRAGVQFNQNKMSSVKLDNQLDDKHRTASRYLSTVDRGSIRKNSNHLKEANLSAFSYSSKRSLCRSKFESLLEVLPVSIYRAKGIIHFIGEKRPSLFNYTCGRYDIEMMLHQIESKFSSQAVFIGNQVNTVCDDILKSIKDCEYLT